MVMLVVLMGSSTGGVLYHFITGVLFDLCGVKAFMYIYLQAMLSLLVLYAVMSLITRNKDTRFTKEENEKSAKQTTEYHPVEEKTVGDNDATDIKI